MPVYPALALLLGGAIAEEERLLKAGTTILGVIFALCAIASAGLLVVVRNTPSPGGISRALQQHPEAYTLSLGHMGESRLAGSREDFAWEKVLQLLVLNRLVDPGSEFREHRQWYLKTAMDALLGTDFAVAEKERLRFLLSSHDNTARSMPGPRFIDWQQ